MGATVLTGKRAAAFQAADGEWIFVLFERTYEKNCHPHRDAWSAIALGRYADVMRRVFLHATSCEGGMLQSRAGDIRPENYIEAWRKELARPLQMHDRKIELQVSKSFRATIPDEKLDAVRHALTSAGFDDRYDALVTHGITVSLHSDIAFLLAIYGGGPLSVWRVLDVDHCSSLPIQADLSRGSKAATAMERMPTVGCYAIDGDNRLIAVGTEAWRHGGWQYNTVGSFIKEVAYAIEMEVPGFAKRAIPHFRDIVRKAPSVPRDTKINITRAPEGVDEWRIRTADEIARGLGIAGENGQAPAEFTFRFGEVLGELNSLLLYKLGGLQREQSVWTVPGQDGVRQTLPPTATLAHEAQLSLCLA